MAFSSQANQNQLPTPRVDSLDKAEIDQELAAALGGLSIDDLMAQSVSKPRPTLDPSRPVRGGRPSASGDAPAPGPQVRVGRISQIRERNVFIDLGGKSQGVVPLEQFDNLPEPGLLVGQQYEFTFNGYDGREGLIMLSRKGAVSTNTFETLREGDIVEGMVTGVNKGGLELKVNNHRAFMPAGQVDTMFHESLNHFVGEKLRCQVSRVDRSDKNLVLSRRALMELEAEENKAKAWTQLSVGQICEGTVRSVQAYGAFVDIGGVDGLLHVSAMSYTRVSDPTKILKPGQKVQVMILQMDPDTQRIGLGLKQLTRNPWESVTQDFAVGSTVTGRVTKLMEFGAFVELAPGVEGLVHISQLSTKRISKVSDAVQEGITVQAKIVQIDEQKKRISLSMADAERDMRAATKGTEVAETHTGSAPATPSETAKAAAAAKPAPARKFQLKGGLS